MKKQSQNKPNLLDAQMNISSVLTKDYENVLLRRRGENKPNQTQFQRQKNAEFKVLPLFQKNTGQSSHFAMYRKMAARRLLRVMTRLSCVFLFEEGLQDFRGGDGVEAFSFLAPGKLGSGQLFLGTETG